jgi:predicted glycogen debranching enzyme
VQATPDSPSLWLQAPGATFAPGGDWYWHYLLREERTRGYDHVEDLYQPGTFHATLLPGDSITLIASAEDPAPGLPDVDVALAQLRGSYVRIGMAYEQRLDQSTRASDPPGELIAALSEAAEAFVVRRSIAGATAQTGVSLIAGYHWFTDWGRDAMICLPGILLATGHVEQAAALLRAFASYCNRGMIPNRFPDTGEAVEYNTADATLWLFQALRQTLQAMPSSDVAATLLADLYPRLREIVEWHQRGTRYGIGVDPADGLLHAGQPASAGTPATQLTWMDARDGDTVHTPRVGKPVEINALWIGALELMASWAPDHGDDPTRYRAAAEQARASFAARFWYADGGYLYDVVDGSAGDDARLRPNQLIALALLEDLLPDEQARRALDVVTERLLTPYGLRTLAPDDPSHHGRCVGDQPARDSAYHQGTVWPWLLGPYVDAYRRLHGRSDALKDLLTPFVAHLREAGLGSVSEIFDSEWPHTPRGCIAQAWSVAELLRIALLLNA